MYSFANDYSEGACPKVLKALVDTNDVQSAGYGVDEYCQAAAAMIRKMIEHDDVAALPFCDLVRVRCETLCGMGKIDVQIRDSAEIDVDIRAADSIGSRILLNIRIHQIHKIISCAQQREADDISTYTVPVIRITGRIVGTFIFRHGGGVFPRAPEDVRLVVQAVAVLIVAADIAGNIEF